MKKEMLLIAVLFCSVGTNAEVYKWTDETGKVHYGDKPKAKAENITSAVKKTNIDTSSQEQQKVGAIFRKENDADRTYYEQQAQGPAISPEKLQACAEAKEVLRKISGRVMVKDENGKPVHYTDQQRKQDAAVLDEKVKENCPP